MKPEKWSRARLAALLMGLCLPLIAFLMIGAWIFYSSWARSGRQLVMAPAHAIGLSCVLVVAPLLGAFVGLRAWFWIVSRHLKIPRADVESLISGREHRSAVSIVWLSWVARAYGPEIHGD